jgi:hypothetical protein
VSKISAFKLEIPCDDPVKAEAVKATLLDAIRALGAKVMAAEAVDGKILAVVDATAFFNAASVKTFVTRGEKQTNTGTTRAVRVGAQS